MCDPCALQLSTALFPESWGWAGLSCHCAPAAHGDHFGHLDQNWHWGFTGRKVCTGWLSEHTATSWEKNLEQGRLTDLTAHKLKPKELEGARHFRKGSRGVTVISWPGTLALWLQDCSLGLNSWGDWDRQKSPATLCCRRNAGQLYLECCMCHAVLTTAWGQR